MKIERIEVQQLHTPLRFRFETSFGSTTIKDFLLISIHGEGEVGYGESVAMPDPFYN